MTTEFLQLDSIAKLVEDHTEWLSALAIALFALLIIKTFKSLGHEQ